MLCIRTAIRTWWRRDEHTAKRQQKFQPIFTITCNYIIYFVIITWCSCDVHEMRGGVRDGEGQWILWILKCKYTFFMPTVLSVRLFSGDIFWSFMELNKRRRTKKRHSHWVQLIFIRLVLFCTNCSWNEIKWTAFWDFQVLMKIQFKVN